MEFNTAQSLKRETDVTYCENGAISQRDSIIKRRESQVGLKRLPHFHPLIACEALQWSSSSVGKVTLAAIVRNF